MGVLHVAIAKSKTNLCGYNLCFTLEDDFILFCAVLQAVRILAFGFAISSLCLLKLNALICFVSSFEDGKILNLG